jgi:hypothetical protein
MPMNYAGSCIGNGISFRKNFAEQTRNCFRYSAEESVHYEAFQGSRKLNSEARNGTELCGKN